MLALLADPQQNGYVLQLATGPQPQVLLDRLQRHGLQQPVWVLERYYPPGTRVPVWAVFVGHYPDRASAQAALAALPEALRRDGPQVRSLAALRAEPQPERLPGS
jgi:septal ring-binding cell division protein DamX